MTETQATRQSLRVALVLIAIVAVIFLLYAGRAFFIPITLAFLFNILFRPVVRWLEQRRIPTVVGATTVMLVGLTAVGAAGFGLSRPLQNWAAELPQMVTEARAKLTRFRKPIQQLSQVAAQLENVDKVDQKKPVSSRAAPPQAPAPSSLKVPSLLAQALGTTTSLIAGLVEVVMLLWLLLASGDLFFEKLLKFLPAAADKRLAERVVYDTESAVASYLVATALINLGEAAAVGGAMQLLGMPNPLLWAVLTFALEFIPYLGGALLVALLTIVAIPAFDNIGHALAAPGAYLAISTLQNNLVSPLIYGRRLRLNPVAVFIGVLFWWSLWGVPGAFLAVPIVATAKILGDHLPRLRAMGEFLGG